MKICTSLHSEGAPTKLIAANPKVFIQPPLRRSDKQRLLFYMGYTSTHAENVGRKLCLKHKWKNI